MEPRSIVYLITNYGIGQTGDQALRAKLTATFLRLQLESEDLPGAICFYTEGVRLACEGSPVLEELKQLEKKGVRLILCHTCLQQFGLVDQVQVGIIGGMGDIITAFQTADSVITL